MQTCCCQELHWATLAALSLKGACPEAVSRSAMPSVKLRFFLTGEGAFPALFLLDILPATLKPSSAGVSSDLGAAGADSLWPDGGKADAGGFLFFFDFFFLLTPADPADVLGASPSSKAKLLANEAIRRPIRPRGLYAVSLSNFPIGTTMSLARVF